MLNKPQNPIDFVISSNEILPHVAMRTKKEKPNLEKFTPDNYHIIYKNKYTIPQIKAQLKVVKEKLSGTKIELLDRLYEYYKNIYNNYKHAVLIQKTFRGKLQRNLNIFRGDGFKNRSICVNDEDFLTMDEMKKIDANQFFSYTVNGVTFGFNIISIYNIITKSCKGSPQNPYNRELIPNEVINDIYKIIKIGKAMNRPIEVYIPSVSENTQISSAKRIELRALDIFQYINSLGNYSDSSWFLSLSRAQLFKLYRELCDIWNYRANLSAEIKINICQPNGNPFINDRLHINVDYNLQQIQSKLLNIFDRMVHSGIDTDSKVLGSYYILASLTLVSDNAKNAMPWLYQSVSYM